MKGIDQTSLPLPSHDFVIEISAAEAYADLAKTVADAQEHINRSFGLLAGARLAVSRSN